MKASGFELVVVVAEILSEGANVRYDVVASSVPAPHILERDFCAVVESHLFHVAVVVQVEFLLLFSAARNSNGMNDDCFCSEHSGDFYGADYSLRHFRVVCVVSDSPSRERSVRLIEHKSRVLRHFSEVLRVEIDIAGVQRAGVV